MDHTSAHVFWRQPEPIGHTIGYQVYYTGPTSGNVSVDGDKSNNQIVSGLVNGEFYHFSVAGRSQHFESEPQPAGQNPLGLGKLYIMLMIFFYLSSIPRLPSHCG